MTALTAPERRDLARHEKTIERGLLTFQEVGSALLAIRDGKLYRDYKTFAEYCEARWHFSDSRARQLIAAAKTAEAVESVTTVTVPNERTARELSRLPEDQQAEAWTEAVDRSGGEPTAKVVREVVEEMAGNDEDEPEPEPDEPEPPKRRSKWDQAKALALEWRNQGESPIECACVLEQLAEWIRDNWN